MPLQFGQSNEPWSERIQLPGKPTPFPIIPPSGPWETQTPQEARIPESGITDQWNAFWQGFVEGFPQGLTGGAAGLVPGIPSTAAGGGLAAIVKTIGVDLLLAALLLLGIYLLFQKPVNLAVTTAAKKGVQAAALG